MPTFCRRDWLAFVVRRHSVGCRYEVAAQAPLLAAEHVSLTCAWTGAEGEAVRCRLLPSDWGAYPDAGRETCIDRFGLVCGGDLVLLGALPLH